MARLVLITGLAPSVLENEDYALLFHIMEMYANDMQAATGENEDKEFAEWKREMGF